MRKALRLTVYAAISFLVICHNPAWAQIFDEDYVEQKTVEFTPKVGLQSARMFRGQNLHNGVSIQLQPRIAINTDWGTPYFQMFFHFPGSQGDTKDSRGGTFEVSDPDEDAEEDDTVRVAKVIPTFNEYDFDLGYTFDFNVAELDVGHKWYRYSDRSPRLHNTQEIYGTLDFNVITHPYATAAYDYDAHSGWYYELGLRQPIPIKPDDDGSAVIPFVKLGLNYDLDGGDEPIYEDEGATHVDFGLNSVFYILDNVAIQPEVHYSEAIDDFAQSEFVFGVNVAGELGL